MIKSLNGTQTQAAKFICQQIYRLRLSDIFIRVIYNYKTL